MVDRNFSDEELVAYLDGESEHTRMEEIEAALKEDLALVERIEGLRIDTEQIAASLETLVNPKAVPPSFLNATAGRNKTLPMIAASLVALIIGLVGGQLISRPVEPDWRDYVAAYQFLYTTNTLSTIEASPASQQSELDRVGAAIGKAISVESLSDFPEVEYKRAQVLGYNSQALVQLAFLSSTGEPLALCIIRANNSESVPLNISSMEGLSAASWNAGGYEYLLIGGKDNSLIERMANNFVKHKI